MLMEAKYPRFADIYKHVCCWMLFIFSALLFIADKGVLYAVFPLVMACSLGSFIIDRDFLLKMARSSILWAFLGFSAYMLAREMITPGMAWDSFVREVKTCFKILVFLLAVAYVSRQITAMNVLFGVMVAASIISSLIIFYDHFANISEYSKISGYIIGDQSHFFWHTFLGGAYAIVVILCLYLLIFCSQRHLLVLFSLTATYSTVMVFLSQSRGAMLSLFLGFCFFMFIHKRRLVAPLLAFLALIVILAFVGKTFLYDPATLLARKDAGRFILWGHAINQINESPLFGDGLSAKYAYDMPGYKVLVKPHNLLLTIGIAGGYIGISLYLLVFFIAFRAAYMRRDRQDGGVVAALLLFSFVFHMFDTLYIFYRPTIDWVLLWLPIGLAIALECGNAAEDLNARTSSASSAKAVAT